MYEPVKQYKPTEQLSRSHYGNVYLCKSHRKEDANKQVELREYYRLKLKETPSGVTAIETLTQINHSNIIKVLDVIDEPEAKRTYLVTDHHPKASMKSVLRETESGLDETTALTYFKQLISAI